LVVVHLLLFDPQKKGGLTASIAKRENSPNTNSPVILQALPTTERKYF
jgi:hypothetical protein